MVARGSKSRIKRLRGVSQPRYRLQGGAVRLGAETRTAAAHLRRQSGLPKRRGGAPRARPGRATKVTAGLGQHCFADRAGGRPNGSRP